MTCRRTNGDYVQNSLQLNLISDTLEEQIETLALHQTTEGMSQRSVIPMTASNATRECKTCHIEKPLAEFYPRGNGMYFTECKTCYREHAHLNHEYVPRYVPYRQCEDLAITKLQSLGIPAAPGKLFAAAFADVVAWGIINIEVKYSRLSFEAQRWSFRFSTTPAQRKRGLIAHLVMLICDYGNRSTFHLLPPSHPVFFRDGHMKACVLYTPDYAEAGYKHGRNRVVMTDAIMKEYQDRWELIEKSRLELSERLKT